MNRFLIRTLLLALFLCVALTACGTETPTPTPQESETTTTTSVTTTTTTTTTATTTTTTTTTTTAKPTTSTTSRTTTSATTTTTAADAYEVDRPLPAKDKRCLLLDAWGGEITLTFDKAMKKNGEVLWHYTGTAKTGVAVTCKIVPESGAVYEVSYGVNTEWGRMTYEDDARACLKQFLQDSNVPLNAKDASIRHAMSGRYEDGKTEYIIFWRYYFELEDGVTVSGDIGLSKGKLVVQSIRATYKEGDTSVQGYLGDAIPLLVPRWKNQ